MKRITICIDVLEEHVGYVQNHVDVFGRQLYSIFLQGDQIIKNWDTCTEEVKDDVDVSHVERQAYGRAEGHMDPKPEDESQQALVEGHLEEKELIELSPGEEATLDDLLRMVIDNHGCTEEVALQTIQARCHTDSDTCDMTEIK